MPCPSVSFSFSLLIIAYVFVCLLVNVRCLLFSPFPTLIAVSADIVVKINYYYYYRADERGVGRWLRPTVWMNGVLVDGYVLPCG